MPALLSPNAKQQFFDNAGNPASGYKLYTYATGTTTPLATYTERGGTVPNANPIVLDARGEATLYLPPGIVYDYVLKTALDAHIWTRPGVEADGLATDLAGTGNGQGAELVMFKQAGTGAVARTSLSKERERVSVKDFGAYGDGAIHPLSERYASLAAAQVDYPHAIALTDSADWCAAVAATNHLLTGEFGGGTIYFPHGVYIFNRKWQIDGIVGPSTTNIWIEGDGPLSTTLDFFTSAGGTDGIVFNGGAHVGVRKLMLDRVPNRGLVLNDNFAGYVSSVTLDQVRVQRCGDDGIYSKNSYLVTMNDVFSNANGGVGLNFVGNHTSIIGSKVYARLNTGAGIAINGAVYISINGQSDENLRGWQLSNIRGGVINAPGTEANKAEGFLITSSDASAANILGEYQNIEGLTIIGATQIRNNANGPVGNNANSFAIITNNNRPIRLTLVGCVDNVTAGDPSLVISAASGAVEVTQIDCSFGGATVNPNAATIRNMSNVGRYALLERAAGAVSIPNNTATAMTWDGFAAGENTLGATFASNSVVIPAGVNSVEVSACVAWAGAAGGTRYAVIQKNGAGWKGSPQLRLPSAGAGVGMEMTLGSTKPIPVVAGDTIRLLLIQDSGAALNVSGATGNANWLCVRAVS